MKNVKITSLYQLLSLSSDPTLNHPRRRHSSGNISTTLEMLPGLEGFQLDTYGRVKMKRPRTHLHHGYTSQSNTDLLRLSVSVCVIRPVSVPH